VHGKALLPNWSARNTLSARSFHDIDSAILHEPRVREIVGMILAGDPDRGSAPGVLESRVEATTEYSVLKSSLSSMRQSTSTVTCKNVAGIVVVSLLELLLWLNKFSNSACKSVDRPPRSGASNAFTVGP
jgi:hypothetical protein